MSALLYCLILGEALSVLLVKAEALGKFEGIPIGNEGLSVSHLQFADSTLIFCQPSFDQLLNIKWLLKCFQAGSGISDQLCA